MKTIILFVFILFIVSCDRKNDIQNTLSASDIVAFQGMQQQTDNLTAALSEISHATTQEQIHHWDSIYHHELSIYWHHHSEYNHDNHHPHNDHHHQWIAYDPSTDHSNHFHHPYPGHPHDSLIVVPNGHHVDPNTHHPDVHTVKDHHVIDSLDRIHQTHH